MMNDSDRVEVRPMDVLYGKGKKSFSHAGNMGFRDMIAEYLEAYTLCTSVSEKSRIVQTVIDAVHALGGRFLRRNQVTDQWMEMQQRHVQDKVVNAFRDASRRGTSRASRNQPSSSVAAATVTTRDNNAAGLRDVVVSAASRVPAKSSVILPNEMITEGLQSRKPSDSSLLERTSTSAKLQQQAEMPFFANQTQRLPTDAVDVDSDDQQKFKTGDESSSNEDTKESYQSRKESTNPDVA